MEDKGKVRDHKLECQQKEIDQLKDQLVKLGESSILREMDERVGKENNLVFHRVEESWDSESKVRIEFDKLAIQQILDLMEVEMTVEKDIKFVRRLGARGGNMDTGKREPRPLLIGLIHRHHSEGIPQNSWKLGKANNVVLRSVSVVKDLTLKQREGERELYKEAASKNLVTQEQIEQNMAFKVVGRRGSKREILAPLRHGEVINTAGEVTWGEVETMGITGRVRGEQVMSSPNCVPIGRAGGTWGKTQDTPLDPIQAREREGGRWNRSVPANGVLLQREMERVSCGRGGGGLKRPAERDVRIVARKGGTANRSPPLKKAFSKTSLTSSMPSPTSSKAITGPSTSNNKVETGSLVDLFEEEGVEAVREEEEDSETGSQGMVDLDLEGAEFIIEGEGVV